MIRRIRNKLNKKNKIDLLREQDVKIRNSVDILNSKIDECYGFLIEIGVIIFLLVMDL